MKIILIAFLSLFSIPTAVAESFENSFLEGFATVYPTLKSNTKNIWPGYEFTKHPLLFHFQESNHVYAFGFLPKSAAWEKTTIDGLSIAYSTKEDFGVADFHFSPQQPYFVVDDQSTTVTHPFDLDSDSRTSVIVNTMGLLDETYFAFEVSDSTYAQSKLELLKKYQAYSGFRQADNLTLLYLENKLSHAYLTTLDNEILKDYVAVEVARKKLLDTNTALFEQIRAPFANGYFLLKGLSANEGEYVKLALGMFDSGDPNFDELSMGEFPYVRLLAFSSVTVDLALDKFNPAWKDAVESQNVSPDVLLQQYFNLSVSELQTRLADVKTRLNYNSLNRSVKAVVDPIAAKINDLETAYKAGNGLELTLSVPDTDYADLNVDYQQIEQYEIDSNTYVENAREVNIASEPYNFTISIKKPSAVYEKASLTAKDFLLKLDPASKVLINGTQTTLEKFIAQGKPALVHELTITSGDTVISLKSADVFFNFESKDGKLGLKLVSKIQAAPELYLAERMAAKHMSLKFLMNK